MRAVDRKTRPNWTKLAQVVHTRLVDTCTHFGNILIIDSGRKCVMAWRARVYWVSVVDQAGKKLQIMSRCLSPLLY